MRRDNFNLDNRIPNIGNNSTPPDNPVPRNNNTRGNNNQPNNGSNLRDNPLNVQDGNRNEGSLRERFRNRIENNNNQNPLNNRGGNDNPADIGNNDRPGKRPDGLGNENNGMRNPLNGRGPKRNEDGQNVVDGLRDRLNNNENNIGGNNDNNGRGRGNRGDGQNVVDNLRDRINNNNGGEGDGRGRGRGQEIFKRDSFLEKLPTVDRSKLIDQNINVDRETFRGKRLPSLQFDRNTDNQIVNTLNNKVFNGKQLVSRTGINVDNQDVRFNGIDRRIRPERLNRIANIDIGRRLNLGRQFDLQRRGDIARRLDLHSGLRGRGGWRNRNFVGGVNVSFTSTHFSMWYAGSGFYPRYVWQPRWSPWVRWSWWDYCYPICDPRPIIVRPIICQPAPVWDYYQLPTWQPLPVATSGTWVDVPPAPVSAANEVDVQLIAVRFIDPGHTEEQLGPRYRVWIRNNAATQITQPFNITLLGGTDDRPVEGLPQEGVRVESMEPDQVMSVDVRMPFEVNVLNTDEQGRRIPFTYLHVVVDSNRELNDVFRENNGIGIAREEVLPIDPWAFAPESDTVPIGSIINVAGEGFGPEPGEVFVVYEGEQYPAEIYGWYDLGVRFQVPEIPVSGTAQTAEILVIRGDGASSNPIEVGLANQATVLAPPTPDSNAGPGLPSP